MTEETKPNFQEEIDPNFQINSDLFPSFVEGFSAYPEGTPIEEQFYQDGINRAVLIRCCDACDCTNSHSSTPSDPGAGNLDPSAALTLCCDLCTCQDSHSSIPSN
jgi:hypothetical protein